MTNNFPASDGQSSPTGSSSTSQSTLSSSSSDENPLSDSLGNPTTSSATQSPSSVTNPESATTLSSSTSAKSKAWIAGAVIGPVFGALILGLSFWVYKLRQGRSQDNQNHAGVGEEKNHGGAGYDPVPASMPEEAPAHDPLYSRTEMSAVQHPSELPTPYGYYK
jgi:hypothetical protein